MNTQAAQSPWKTAEDGLRERAAKKEAVLLAAARLFASDGYRKTSLDDVARSLQVTKPTLYYYIDGKEQILLELAGRTHREFSDGLARLRADGLAGRALLREALLLYGEVACGDSGRCVFGGDEDGLSRRGRQTLRGIRAQTDALLRELIEVGLHDGSAGSFDPATTTFAVTGALTGIGRWFRAEGQPGVGLRDAIDLSVRMLMRGVLSEPGGAHEPDATILPPAVPAIRLERHFGNRVQRCYALRPKNLASLLADAAADVPQREALVCDGLRLSWQELHYAVIRCAGGLVARGIGPGDRIALYLGNEPEFIIVTLACAWMGAVPVPIHPQVGANELAFTLADAAVSAIVCETSLVNQLPPLPPTVAVRIVTGAPATGFEPFSSLTAAAPLPEPHLAEEEDLAALLYTSGTIGRPKGAMVTHLNIIHSLLHFGTVLSLGDAERSLLAVPAGHVSGMVAQIYLMTQRRGTIVLMRKFRPAEFVRLAAAERITHTILVPSMYNLCLLLPDLEAHDLSAWRWGIYGGAPMPTATIDGLSARLPGLMLTNAYGATETTSPAAMMPPDQTPVHRTSVGRPVPCADIGIFDAAGNALPPGGIGEVWIAGPMIVPGYWRNPEATASEFVGGWWRSGDIGCLDAAGYLRLLDREKDLIIRGGYKIYSAEIENALAEHPLVVESALVGMPCAVFGERVHAYVCVRALDARTEAAALADFCACRVADYAIPETWSIGIEPLPRTATGKVIKRELRRAAMAAAVNE